MRTLQIYLGILTFGVAAVCLGVTYLVFDDLRASIRFIRIDFPLLMTMLAGLLSIGIARSGQYEFAIVLVGALIVAVLAAISLLMYPLLALPAVLLILTSVVAGLNMKRAWRVNQSDA